jgi:hypothetical protein
VIEFKAYYTVVRKHVPFVTGVPREEIPRRIYRQDTTTKSEFVSHRTGVKTVLEFDGEIFWRVGLSDRIAPDGVKRIAYVVGGIRKDQVWFPRRSHDPLKIVNSLLNQQYHEHVFVKNKK